MVDRYTVSLYFYPNNGGVKPLNQGEVTYFGNESHEGWSGFGKVSSDFCGFFI